MPHLVCIFHPYYLTLSVLSYCISLKYFGEIKISSVILSTSPCASTSLSIVRITTIPSKLSHRTEKMARTSRSHPGDGSRSVISRSERYLQLEKKRSIATTHPRIVTKVVRDKKLATTTNDDVTSPLSTTASLATCPALPRMEEWAQSKELLERTIENNDEDDDSNDDGDGGGKCDGEFNKVAKMAVKSSDVDDDYSNAKLTIRTYVR